MTGLSETGSRSRETFDLMTPEGVSIRYRLAPAGDRIMAFAIDLVGIIICVSIVYLLAYILSGIIESVSWLVAFIILMSFLVRMFYFTAFELRWQGATPGKRRLGLRVIDRGGGTLTGDAIFVRNVMREIEFFLPLQAVFVPTLILPNARGLALILALVWFFLLAFIPLFNRYRLRAGDLAAGTLVVCVPNPMLLADLGESSEQVASDVGLGASRFSPEQLSIYGVYELQVLEELLRRAETESDARAAVPEVARKIVRKIGWQGAFAEEEPHLFLRDFYSAQRARLERDMLLGERKERKR